MSARVPKREAPPSGRPPAGPPVKAAGPGGVGPSKKKPLKRYKLGGKWIFTPLSIAEALGAAALFLAALGVGWSAWKDFRLEHNFNMALVNVASNQIGPAVTYLDAATKARPMDDWPYPLLLQAKLDTNEGKLEDAEADYKQLEGVKAGTNKWTTEHEASIRVGLGCIYLRRYDKEMEESKGARADQKWLQKAEQAFKEAKGIYDDCLEAEIGLAHLALRRGYNPNPKPNQPQIDKDTCEEANKLLLDVDRKKKAPTIDGLVDKYMAQGVIRYNGNDYRGAEEEFRKAFQLQPAWKAPFANVAFMMSRRFITTGTAGLDEMMNSRPEYDEFAQRLESLYLSDNERYKIFQEARYSFYNSLGYALCKGFRWDEGNRYLEDAKAIDNKSPTVDINLADIYYFYSTSNKFEKPVQIQHANNARNAWLAAAEKCRSTQQPRKRFLCLYNRAIILYSMQPDEQEYQAMMNDELKSIEHEFAGEWLVDFGQAVALHAAGAMQGAVTRLGQAIKDLDNDNTLTPAQKQQKRDEADKLIEEWSKGK